MVKSQELSGGPGEHQASQLFHSHRNDQGVKLSGVGLWVLLEKLQHSKHIRGENCHKNTPKPNQTTQTNFNKTPKNKKTKTTKKTKTKQTPAKQNKNLNKQQQQKKHNKKNQPEEFSTESPANFHHLCTQNSWKAFQHPYGWKVRRDWKLDSAEAQ